MMRLDPEERQAVVDALRELDAGRAAKFEDRLWLAFGDGWTRVRTALARHGYIALEADVTSAITPRGSRLLRAMAAPQHARAS